MGQSETTVKLRHARSVRVANHCGKCTAVSDRPTKWKTDFAIFNPNILICSIALLLLIGLQHNLQPQERAVRSINNGNRLSPEIDRVNTWVSLDFTLGLWWISVLGGGANITEFRKTFRF